MILLALGPSFGLTLGYAIPADISYVVQLVMMTGTVVLMFPEMILVTVRLISDVHWPVWVLALVAEVRQIGRHCSVWG